MPRTPSTTDPSERFRSIFDRALKAYTKKTEKNLLSLPLFRDINACDSPEDILNKLRDRIPGFDKPDSSDVSLSKWLTPIVNVLYALSATLGEGVGLVFSPGKVVFAGVGVLLLAAKDVAASQDTLIDIFRRVESFLGRLETYTHVSLSDDMTNVIVNIMAEVLSILAIATRDIKQGRGKKFVKKLMGEADIEDALGRLDKLTQDEVRMAVAQNLKTTHQILDVGEKAGAILQQIASDVDDKNQKELRQKLRQWLSPPDPLINYNTACSLHHEGTAEWFTNGPVFADWKESGSLLWVYGKPGSGKSVLSSAIIQNIKCIANTGSAHVAYFFFDFKDSEKQETRGLLTSILHQLCDQSLPCLDILSRLYSAHHDGSEQLSDGALRQCLKDMFMIAGQVPIYLVIDALDESPNTRGVPSSRRRVLGLVKENVGLKRPNLRVCVTSRDEMDIRVVLEPLTPTSLSLHNQQGQNEDIVDYVTSVVYSDPELNMRGWQEEDKELVITTLSDRAGGMFRWVHCQVEILRQCFARNLRRTLDELPKTLDATYDRILREIPEQNRHDAIRLLQCLTVAVRPLRVEELAEVLAVDFTSEDIPKLNVDSRWGDQEQAVLLACSSLISIVQGYDRQRGRSSRRLVQFSHFSVKEFLTSERLAEAKGDISHYYIRPEPAHAVMAQACVAVLFRLDYSISTETIESFPLAEYAAENFSKHAEFEDVLTQIPDAVDYLLDAEKPHFAAWLWALKTQFGRLSERWKRAERPKTVPLYYVAEFGFCGLVQHILSKRPQDVNAQGGDCGTALHVALNSGHVEVSKLLLAHCVDVDVRSIESRTPLHLASKKGYVDVGQQLLDRNADVDAQDNNHSTPLHLASSQQNVEVTKLLIQCGANVRLRNNNGETPLHLASKSGYHDTMRLLLDRGADVDAQDNNHSTPLQLALSQRNVEAAKLLVECGANVQVRDDKGETPLHLASEYAYDDIMRLLLDRGADVDTQDDNHSTPLHLASSQWNVRVAELLVECGANVQLRYNNGKTSLHLASQYGYHPTMRLLLDRGVDVDAQDDNHSTPLHLASQQNVEAVKLLIECGANVQSRNNKGETPLHLVSKGGYHDTVQLLLDQGADVDAEDDNYSTPLHLALSQWNVEAAKLLVECGANVQVRNNNGQTPLHLASKGGYHGTMQLLLDRGVGVDAQDDNRSTPLHLASSQWNVEAAKLLVKCGANVQVQENNGQTPLHLASKGGYHRTMRLLLDRGVDVDVQDDNHSTPLHLASSQRNVEAAKLLVECGANVQLRNNKGETSLHLASKGGYHDTMRLFLDRGVDVDAQDGDHSTPLHLASSQRYVEAAKLLVECGANVQVRNDNGQTPLHLALKCGYLDTMRLLLDRGADVEARDHNHSTPLQLALSQRNVEAVMLLVECGANVQLRSNKGETSLHLASQCGYHHTMRLLLDRGADVDAQDNNHKTPLHIASYEWDLEAVQLLLQHGANVRAKDKEGRTSLHFLVTDASNKGENWYLDALRLLLEHDVDVSAQDNKHSTPLHLASFYGSLEAVRLLLQHGANIHVQNGNGKVPFQVASARGHREIMRLLSEYVQSGREMDSCRIPTKTGVVG